MAKKKNEEKETAQKNDCNFCNVFILFKWKNVCTNKMLHKLRNILQ